MLNRSYVKNVSKLVSFSVSVNKFRSAKQTCTEGQMMSPSCIKKQGNTVGFLKNWSEQLTYENTAMSVQ